MAIKQNVPRGNPSGGWGRWLPALAVLAVLVAGGYLLSTRPGHFEPAADGMIAFPPASVPPGGRAGGPPMAPGQRAGSGPPMPGFATMGREMKVVDLNTGTLAEIETLPGITPAYAKKIVAGRPYQVIEDLERAGIPHQIVQEISPPAIIRRTERVSPPPSTPKPIKQP